MSWGERNLNSSFFTCLPRKAYQNNEWEWMNEAFYIALLLCIAIHPKHFTIMWGVSPQPPPVCSIHLDDATAATTQRCQCAHHTPATGGEERESHRANQVDGDYWEAMIDKGQWREFGQDTRFTPLLFTMSVMSFLMTTESQDLSLTSHPKDGALLTV